MDTRAWTQQDIAGCVGAVLRSRRSVRAFLPRPVSREQVLDILRTASCAPSNSNTQPWRVHVVAGEPKQRLAQALEAAFDHGDVPPPEHFPDPLPDEFQSRQADFGAHYYGTLNIDRGDMAARNAQTRRNFSFFGAPVGLVFAIDGRLTRHSWLDLGLFVQNVMIAARCRGLDTCPQVSFARYHAVVAEQLAMGPHEVTACGMSMGYADADARVNGMQLPRRDVDDFARLAGF